MPVLSRREFLKLMGLTPAAAALDLISPYPGLTGTINKGSVSFTINGNTFRYSPQQEQNLLDLLRNRLGLIGTKYGCGAGVCGACTVLINGRPMRSCAVHPGHLNGLDIVTIEGLGGSGNLDPVQKTFADLSVFQCGYCAPGCIMATRALLDRTPNPTRTEVIDALYGNLCRCTGYIKIFDAVRAVNDSDFRRYLLGRPNSGVFTPSRELQAVEKVTGRLRYARDYAIENPLYAKVVWSEHTHAAIENIDTAAAAAMPGVVRVLTHKDIPGKKRMARLFRTNRFWLMIK